jgi:hypothetical protein
MKEYDERCDTVEIVKMWEGDKYKVVHHVIDILATEDLNVG